MILTIILIAVAAIVTVLIFGGIWIVKKDLESFNKDWRNQ